MMLFWIQLTPSIYLYDGARRSDVEKQDNTPAQVYKFRRFTYFTFIPLV